jgi:hypothetical protein
METGLPKQLPEGAYVEVGVAFEVALVLKKSMVNSSL